MPKPWKGKLAADIHETTPDRTPFVQPTAPEGALNVLFILSDDVGYAVLSTEKV